MDDRRKELFYNNLLLLGFDAKYMEKQYNVKCHSKMFDVPNKKGFEVVSYFLFTKLNTVCPDQFPIVWPILERSIEHEFRKTCYSHLTTIAKDDSVTVRFPRIFPTYLQSPSGDRFYELYLAFSTYVLLKVIKKHRICKPLHRPSSTSVEQNFKQVKEILQLSTVIATNEFVSTQQYSLWYENKMQEVSDYFVHHYRQLKSHLQNLCKQVEEKTTSLCEDILGTTSDSHEENMKTLREKSSRLLYEVACACNHAEKLLSYDKKLWDKIKTELNSESIPKVILDGKKYMIQIPDILRSECKQDFVKKGVQSLIENGKFSFSSFLDVCLICLDHYKQELEEVGFPDSCKIQGLEERHIQSLDQNLKTILSCRQTVFSKVLPDLRESLERLRSSILPKFADQNEKFSALNLFSPLNSVHSHIPTDVPETVFTPPTAPLRLPAQHKRLGEITDLFALDLDVIQKERAVRQKSLIPHAVLGQSVEPKSNAEEKNAGLKNICIGDILLNNWSRDASVRSCIEHLNDLQDTEESSVEDSFVSQLNTVSSSQVFRETHFHCIEQLSDLNSSATSKRFSISQSVSEGANKCLDMLAAEISEPVKLSTDFESSALLDDMELIDDAVLPPIPSF